MPSTLSHQTIAAQFYSLPSDGFYHAGVKYFAQLLNVKCVLFAQNLSLLRSQAKPLSVFCDGEFKHGDEYQLSDTPCDKILLGKPYGIYGQLTTLYPNVLHLVGMDFVSYIGFPLIDEKNQVVAHIAILDDKHIEGLEDAIIGILTMLSHRMVLQVERTNSTAQINRINHSLSLPSGQHFCRQLTKHIGDSLAVEHTFIGHFQTPQCNVLQLDSLYSNGKYIDIQSTVCELTVDEKLSVVFSDMFTHSPHFDLLKQLDAHHFVAHKLVDADGKIIGYLGIISGEEIQSPSAVGKVLSSYVVKAQKELSEDRDNLALTYYQRMLSTTSDGMAFIDSDYNYRSVNNAFSQFFACEEQHITNCLGSKLHGEVCFEQFIKPNLVIALSGEAVTFEIKNKITDGQVTYFQIQYDPYINEQNQVVGVVAAVRDITQLKQVELTLRKSEERFQQLYNKTPSMFFTIDEHWIIRSANAFAAKKLGFKAKELINKNMLELYPLADQMQLHEHFSQCFGQPKKVHEWEIKQLRRDGYHLWVKQTARVVVSKAFGCQLFLASEDISEKHRLSQKLSYQASHDSLTGLTNRLAFERSLRELVNQEDENLGLVHVLAFIDLDRFKIVNDTCGHLTGDELLRRIAEILTSKVRKSDVLARIGGDEFAILMADCELEKSIAIAESIREAVQDYVLVWKDQSFQVGASIGLTVLNLKRDTIVEAMAAADEACYAAKEAGRNRVFVYCEERKRGSGQREDMQWLNKLNTALCDDGFVLFAQPIVHSSGVSKKVNYELLLRYDAGDEFIPAELFLPIAKQHQLSVRIDEWVVNNACSWLSNYNLSDQMGYCAINISGASLADPEFLEFVLFSFRKYQLDGKCICFEINEVAAIADLLGTINFITELKKQGCLFALDNFGSGLASFSHIKSLPVDIIKISNDNVMQIEHDPIVRTIVSSINDIAHSMSKVTMACYVENEQIEQTLIDMGIDYVQGYYVGKPKRLSEL